MKNITVCLRRMWTIGWMQSLAVMAFLLVVGGGPPLAAAAALGPTDGNGLAPTDLERVTVGNPAPNFTLEDENGKPVTLSQFRGKRCVILVFYRGHW
jgi:cytochrome oxidase Cu insertion factor (SCO1/SenC/PrrC family)